MNNKKYRAILFTVIVFIILVISTIAASWTKLMDFIYDVATSCGCTTVEYDKRPILPGQSLNMSINFRPLSKEYFSKRIFIRCNVVNSPIILEVRGEVI